MNRDSLLLDDMIRACDKVARYIVSGREAFLSEELIQDAVIRNLEIIGEASKHLSDSAKGFAPEQPWRLIAGMRDKLIHHYFGVNLELVWETASAVVPGFRESLLQIREGTGE